MLEFEYDATGRLVKEIQDKYEIERTYDEIGNRTFIKSSLGAAIATKHTARGQVSHLAASQGQNSWFAKREFNELGQEIERLLPGDVISSSQYDILGRVTSHKVSSQDEDVRHRKYEWDVNRRLKKISDELTNQSTVFTFNYYSELVGADYGYRDVLYRHTDEAGNIYKTEDKSDRIYGKGSRLEQSGIDLNEKKNRYQGGKGELVTRGIEYFYDGEGNLVKQVDASGPWMIGLDGKRVYHDAFPTWEYEYFGNGMLKCVRKPDGEVISFKYDSLGRRVEKKSDDKTMKFVWDGNNLMHEWVENQRFDTLVTWIFDEGTFVPSGKLTKDGNYSIISDYLGTPVEAYDEEGRKVWEQELDIYGRVRPRPDDDEPDWARDDDYVELFDEHSVFDGFFWKNFNQWGDFYDKTV
jgi:hypothetical protein